MTHKETVTISLQPYEFQILEKAHDFALENIEDDLPEELFDLLKQLQLVTQKLINMDPRYGQ